MKLRFALLLLIQSSLLAAADLVFADGSEWETVSAGHQFAEGMAWDRDGHFYFTDVPAGQLFKVARDSGLKTLLDGATGKANGIAFGPDGRLYGCASGDKSIYAWVPKTWEKVAVTQGTQSNDIAIMRDGTIFYTDPNASLVWRLARGTFTREVGAKLAWKPNGIALSLDQKTLLVAEFDSDTIHGFSLDGESKVIGAGRPAYRVGVPSDSMGKLDGMMVLANGRLIIGTSLGMQIASPVDPTAGKSRLVVVPSPQGRPRCNYARISPDRAWLYTAYRFDLLRRRLRPDFDRP